LHHGHGLAAALNAAIASLDAQHLSTADFTLETLAQLVRQVITPALGLQLHGLTAATDTAFATLGNDHLAATHVALVSLANLISQIASPRAVAY
jgi:hypothetical protein